MRNATLVASFSLLLLLGATVVHADPIEVATDRIFANSGGVMLDLDGDTFIANATGAADLRMLPAMLNAGQQIDLTHTFNGTFTAPFEFSGPHALVNGTSYDNVDLQATNFAFQSSPFALQPGVSSAPFSFTGTLSGYAPGQQSNALFTADLIGSGTAEIMTHLTDHGALALDSISYNFEPGSVAPAPEPESLVLLAFGMIALAAGWGARYSTAHK